MKDYRDHTRQSSLRRFLLKGLMAIPAAMLLSVSSFAATPPTSEVNTSGIAVTDDTVTVGILHSLTGTMAISETGAQEAEKLAIKQINDMGGILGRKIELSKKMALVTGQHLQKKVVNY